VWGLPHAATLSALDRAPAPALKEARSLLQQLGALDATGRLPPVGDGMRSLAVPARLAHMVVEAGKRRQAQRAAELAVLLTERGLGGSDIDLDMRISRFR